MIAGRNTRDIMATVLMMIVAIGGSAACAEEKGVLSVTATPLKSSTPAITPMPLGESAMVGQLQLTVTEFEFTSSAPIYVYGPYDRKREAAPGAKLLWVHVNGKNTSEVKYHSGDNPEFYVLFKGSEERMRSLGDTGKKALVLFGDIFPGVVEEGWLYAEIPIAAEPEELIIRIYNCYSCEPPYYYWSLK